MAAFRIVEDAPVMGREPLVDLELFEERSKCQVGSYQQRAEAESGGRSCPRPRRKLLIENQYSAASSGETPSDSAKLS